MSNKVETSESQDSESLPESWRELDGTGSARLSRLFYAYSLIGAAVFGLFTAIMYIRGRMDLALGCLIGTAATLLNLVLWRTTRRLELTRLILVVVGALSILWVIACDSDKTSPYFWSLFFVLVPFSLLGHTKGLIAGTAFAVAVLALAYHTRSVIGTEAGGLFFIRFTASLIGTEVFVYLVERSRYRAQQNYEQEIRHRHEVAKLLRQTNEKLMESAKQVRILSGFLPICANCKKIRDDQGYWKQLESYISEHSEAQFTHGLCDQCAIELYGEELLEDSIPASDETPD